jgi:4-amino-4-deoxy-L-arabinose transferase-like glycosyltransferase
LPGWELAHGLGFSPELRRTPGYPLFVALAVKLFGDDLRGLTFAQHGLGVATAGLAWALGRRSYGALAGLLAGLAVALSGPLLVYEHYVLTEALFTMLLALAMLLALRALEQPSHWRLVALGVALAAAALTRPVAYAAVPIVVVALVIRARRPVPVARGLGWLLLGLGSLFLPWMARNALAHGSFAAEGALGQALIGRTARHDDPDRFYRCPATTTSEDRREAAVAIICQAAEEAGDEAPSGGLISQRVRERLGLSQAETSSLLRAVALEAIGRNLGYYVSGSLKHAGTILIGKRETVLAPWRERTTRNWDNRWDPRLTPLVRTSPAAEGPEYARADGIVSLFQPWRWRHPLALLLGIGLVGAALLPPWRPALLLPAAAGAIVLSSAALDGDVFRYRYPVDPLMAVTIGGGAEALLVLAGMVLTRLSGRQAGRQAVPAKAVERTA